ncbi:MAG: hypothetical protein ACREV1_06495 [Gammaproteobacteria bacterium]
MMKLFFALSGIALSTVAMAQSTGMPPYTPDPGPVAGNWEATLSGTGDSDTGDGFDNSDFGFAGSIGYYLTKNIPLTFKQGVNYADVGNSSFLNGRSVFQAAYQWDFARWQPYLGLNLGGLYGAGVEDDGVWGPEGGLKFFVNESTFIFGSISYEMLISECCKDGVVPYSLGIGFDF